MDDPRRGGSKAWKIQSVNDPKRVGSKTWILELQPRHGQFCTHSPRGPWSENGGQVGRWDKRNNIYCFDWLFI